MENDMHCGFFSPKGKYKKTLTFVKHIIVIASHTNHSKLVSAISGGGGGGTFSKK